jgi:hypothetical protein
MNYEAGLIGEFPNDFYGVRRGVLDALAVVGTIGKRRRDKRVPLSVLLE